jgi:hypothetical protein
MSSQVFFSEVAIGIFLHGYVGVLISLWLSKGILFLQANAAPFKAAITHQKLTDLRFEVLIPPDYLPNLAPSDYDLFPNLFIQPKTYQLLLVYHCFLAFSFIISAGMVVVIGKVKLYPCNRP